MFQERVIVEYNYNKSLLRFIVLKDLRNIRVKTAAHWKTKKKKKARKRWFYIHCLLPFIKGRKM